MDRVSHSQDAARDLVDWSSLVSLAIETGWMGHVERRDRIKKDSSEEWREHVQLGLQCRSGLASSRAGFLRGHIG